MLLYIFIRSRDIRVYTMTLYTIKNYIFQRQRSSIILVDIKIGIFQYLSSRIDITTRCNSNLVCNENRRRHQQLTHIY